MNTSLPQLSTASRRILWRRIWYSFVLSLILRPAFLYGILFGGSVQLLREMIFVRMVIANFLTVEIGQAPSYMMHVLTHAELTKLILLIITAVSFGLFVYSIKTLSQLQTIPWRGGQLM